MSKKRFMEVFARYLEYFLLYKLNKHKKKFLGRRIRECCEKLGITYIKMGQILSMRYDILPDKDCEELQKLLDNTTPISYTEIKNIIRKDFRKSPEQLFTTFEKKPIASASIAQVHKAKIKNVKVAVKIKRPNIEEQILKDIKVIKSVVSFVQLFSPLLRHVKATKIVKQIESWLLEEIDFKHEARNIERIKKLYKKTETKLRKDLGKGTFFTTIPKYCKNNVITTQFVEGIPLNKSKTVENNKNYNIKKSLKTYLTGAIRTLFENKTYLFNADPHPANIIAQKNGDAANIDCGIIGYFNEKETKKVKQLLLTVYAQNLEEVIEAILDACNAPPKFDKKIREDIKIYLKKTPHEGFGFWFVEILRICMKHRVPYPYMFSLFGRMMIVMDGLVKKFFPGKTTLDILGKELRIALRKKLIEEIKDINYDPILYNLVKKAKKSPEQINKLIDKYADNPLQFIKDIKGTS